MINHFLEYTYERFERCKSVEKIEQLSYDAAVHIAKTNSVASTEGSFCMVFTEYHKDLNGKPANNVFHFKDGKCIANYVLTNAELKSND